jgi:hypothetical protein
MPDADPVLLRGVRWMLAWNMTSFDFSANREEAA